MLAYALLPAAPQAPRIRSGRATRMGRCVDALTPRCCHGLARTLAARHRDTPAIRLTEISQPRSLIQINDLRPVKAVEQVLQAVIEATAKHYPKDQNPGFTAAAAAMGAAFS